MFLVLAIALTNDGKKVSIVTGLETPRCNNVRPMNLNSVFYLSMLFNMHLSIVLLLTSTD